MSQFCTPIESLDSPATSQSTPVAGLGVHPVPMVCQREAFHAMQAAVLGRAPSRSCLPPVSVPLTRNHHAWLSIADFLTRQNLCDSLRRAQRGEGAPLAGEGATRCGGVQPVPHGNHGDKQNGAQR